MRWNEIPWDEVGEEATQDLQALLRIDSSNPPGNEKAAAEFVAERLHEDGLEPLLLESAPERMNVITRIEGRDDSLPPLLLSAHLDVVPATGDWSVPPFSGERKDGFVWGRGAIDMKNMVVMCMWMMKLLQRMDEKPRRTVIFAAVADEEQGCHHGSHWLVDHHKDKLQAQWMISEVGGFSLYIQGKRFYPIQVAEKGQVTIKMTTRGVKGHGSTPRPHSANTQLAEAIAKIGNQWMPRHVTPPQRRFIEEVASHLPFPFRRIFPLLLTPIGDRILNLLPVEQSAPLRANFHNTASVTVMQAGGIGERNVVPGEATAWIDGRTLPGQTSEHLLRDLRAIVGKGPELRIEDDQPPIYNASFDNELYQLMCQAVRRHDPEGIPVPYMVPGFTDAKAYHRLGIQCYGFSPLKMQPDLAFSTLFHGVNERIPVDGFQWGLRTLADVVGKFAKTTGA